MEHGSIFMHQLGVLTPTQFHAALQRFRLGEFIAAAPIPFGLFGQNVFVTSTEGQFVLRGCPHYDWQFPTEQFWAHLIHDRTTVPVPYPYLLDPATDIFGWSYVLMPQMPGLQLADTTVVDRLALPDRVRIAQAMARTLAELHTISHPYAGVYDYQTATITPFSDDYRTMIVAEIRAMLAESRTYTGSTTEADVAWVEGLIRHHQAALHEPYTVSLVFRDFKEANVVVQHEAGQWQVSGVFDLMEAHFGDRERDLARAVGLWLRTEPACADAFVRAYVQHYPPASGFRERQQLYMVHDCLIIWTYWQRHDDLPDHQCVPLQGGPRPPWRFGRPFNRKWKHASKGKHHGETGAAGTLGTTPPAPQVASLV